MTEDDAILAGELALGLLEGDERAAALRRVLAEPAFAARVERWRAHFATLFGEAPEVVAPEQLERRVMERLTGAARDMRRWRATALVASLAAACLLVVVTLPRPAAPPAVIASAPRQPVLIAALGGKDAKPYNALYDSATGEVTVIGAATWADDRSAELWVIANGGAPRPLGLIGRGANARLRVPNGERAVMAPGATLAVSIEPTGGSPTGAPTGPVVASGALVAG